MRTQRALLRLVEHVDKGEGPPGGDLLRDARECAATGAIASLVHRMRAYRRLAIGQLVVFIAFVICRLLASNKVWPFA